MKKYFASKFGKFSSVIGNDEVCHFHPTIVMVADMIVMVVVVVEVVVVVMVVMKCV